MRKNAKPRNKNTCLTFIALIALCFILILSGCSSNGGVNSTTDTSTRSTSNIETESKPTGGDIPNKEPDNILLENDKQSVPSPEGSESPNNTTDNVEQENDNNVNEDTSDKTGEDADTENITPDNTAPMLTITAPSAASSNNPEQAQSSTYTVEGSAFDRESGLSSVTVNGAKVDVRSDGSWMINLSLTANIVKTVTVVATDNAGNTTTVVKYVEYKKATSSSTKTAYALILDNSNNSETDERPMVFVTSNKAISVGDEYNSKTYGKLIVKYVYTGFDTASYSSAGQVPWYKNWITSVVVEDQITPNSTAYWFCDMNYCTKWDVSKLDTGHVIDMSYTFYQAGYDADALVIDLTDWDVSSVNNMAYMFYNTGYKADEFFLDLTGWDTSSVVNMSNLFRGAGYNAEGCVIDGIAHWDTSLVEDMSYAFHRTGFDAATFVINLSKWDTSSVENMDSMFSYSGYSAKIWSIGCLSNWDVSSVTDMSDMFSTAGRNAVTFTIIGLDNWDTASVADMGGMFSFAGYNATTWSIGDISDWDTSSVTNMHEMFMDAGYNANGVSLDLSEWNVSKVSIFTDFDYHAGIEVTAPEFK